MAIAMNRLVPLALRDLALAFGCLTLWAGALGTRHGAAAFTAHVVTGFATAGVGYLVHEWGHLIGAVARKSRIELPAKLTAIFLFSFDVGCNDRRQFNAMVFGGFAASLLYVAFVFLAVPWSVLAGKVAIVLTVAGVAATFIFEVPTAWRVFRGGPLPQQGPAFFSTPPARSS